MQIKIWIDVFRCNASVIKSLPMRHTRLISLSRIKSSQQPGAPRTTYLNQISSHILQSGENSLEAGEIRKMEVNKSEWSQLFVVFMWKFCQNSCERRKSLLTDLLSLYDDDDESHNGVILFTKKRTDTENQFVETWDLSYFKCWELTSHWALK